MRNASGNRDDEHAQDQAAEDREQSRIGADAERERGDGHECETRALTQPAQRRTDVVRHAIDHANRPDVMRIVDGEGDTAKQAPARVCGVLRRETVTLECVLAHRAVRLDLLPQIGIVMRAAKEVPQTPEDRGHRDILVMAWASRLSNPGTTPTMSFPIPAESHPPCGRTRHVHGTSGRLSRRRTRSGCFAKTF